jgi:hypothetical protein
MAAANKSTTALAPAPVAGVSPLSYPRATSLGRAPNLASCCGLESTVEENSEETRGGRHGSERRAWAKE